MQSAPRSAPFETTSGLVSAIAADVWRLYGENGMLNWAGARRHLDFIVRQARKEVARSTSAGTPGTIVRSQPAGVPGRTALSVRGKPRARRATRGAAQPVLGTVREPRSWLIAKIRRQIADNSYDSEAKLEAAVCGLADELDI